MQNHLERFVGGWFVFGPDTWQEFMESIDPWIKLHLVEKGLALVVGMTWLIRPYMPFSSLTLKSLMYAFIFCQLA